MSELDEGNICYPSDYKIYREGDILCLTVKEDKPRLFKRIKNRAKFLPRAQMDATNWLMAAAASEYNAKTISDWLQMYDDVFGVFCIAIDSDREIELRLFNPKSDQRLGSRKDDDVAITPETSPINNATVITHSWGDTMIPAWKLKNPTEYTPLYVFIQAYGHRYYTENAKDRAGKSFTESYLPPAYEPINVRTITGGGE